MLVVAKSNEKQCSHQKFHCISWFDDTSYPIFIFHKSKSKNIPDNPLCRHRKVWPIIFLQTSHTTRISTLHPILASLNLRCRQSSSYIAVVKMFNDAEGIYRSTHRPKRIFKTTWRSELLSAHYFAWSSITYQSFVLERETAQIQQIGVDSIFFGQWNLSIERHRYDR